ncbi:Kinesin-like protein KIFC3 [Larimichthys crocea]|uniref:Kinesin-like protein KIFC3 n=1 Tax=Larimichthys crocea TaxID=215358 RepID=A0A6G0J2X5_LARCR|nr:Kinesin-like protein KIFC3 [Larimichthys crocea]
MLGWVGTLINKGWLDRDRYVHLSERKPFCGRGQPVQRPSALLSPAVMFSTRKTWDLSHAPRLQELWKKDISLDASSLDFLMSDGEDDASFLSLPTAAFSQRPSLTAELSETNAPSQQLLIQTLQDKVSAAARERPDVSAAQRCDCAAIRWSEFRCLNCPEEEQLVTRLRTQVEELEEKLLDQTQEVERLRSELGATDLEKQLELLVVENQRLKQELKSCRSSDIQSVDAAAGSCSCSHSQDADSLRREVSRWESQARQRERRLAELERELLEKSSRVESLRRQLDESNRQLEDGRRQLDESRWRQVEAEQKLNLRLQECEEELARQAATPPRVKYVTHTVEVESADSQKAVVELQTKNSALQDQLSVQRTLLRELETQLHESQRTCGQLRTQILVYEGEMERAQGQLEAEMQNLEEEKNRVIEEAFIRAESEMKAVHENLAGVRMNLLSLQPALRTLTGDYNCLKRQVQDFPFMLDKAISEAKQEICQVISELVRLKGNIRVFCRVRPVSQEEQDSADAKAMLSFDSDDDAILYLSSRGKVMTFELDKVFAPQATQEEVFQEVQSLVTSCIDGFNVCIFAYGQTGSGKTFTMEGVVDDPGINQRALRLLFSEVTEKAPDWDYTITVSMVEIYNETLR